MTSKPQDYIKLQPPPQGIVCKPVTDDDTNGFGTKPKQFLSLVSTQTAKATGLYEKTANGSYELATGNPTSGPLVYVDTTEKVYTRKEIDDSLVGGNCYWRRSSDGLTLSWDGPWGLNYAPPPSVQFVSFTNPIYGDYNSSVIEVAFVLDFGLVTRNLVSYARFQTSVFCHGNDINMQVPPGAVLGACMLQDNIVIAVATSRLEDSFYYSKLSELQDNGWLLAGAVTFTDVAGERIHGFRNNSYSFDDDGLNFNTIVPVADRATILAATTTANVIHISRIIVRGNLAIDGNGVITVDSTTFEDRTNIPTRDITNVLVNNVASPPATTGTGTGTEDTTTSNPQSDYVFAIGFKNNAESLVESTAIAYQDTLNEVWDIVGVGDNSGTSGSESKTRLLDYKETISIDGVPLFERAADFTQTQSDVGVNDGNQNIIVNGSDDSTDTSTTYKIFFVDIANDLVAYNKQFRSTVSLRTTTDGDISRDTDDIDNVNILNTDTVNESIHALSSSPPPSISSTATLRSIPVEASNTNVRTVVLNDALETRDLHTELNTAIMCMADSKTDYIMQILTDAQSFGITPSSVTEFNKTVLSNTSTFEDLFGLTSTNETTATDVLLADNSVTKDPVFFRI